MKATDMLRSFRGGRKDNILCPYASFIFTAIEIRFHTNMLFKGGGSFFIICGQ